MAVAQLAPTVAVATSLEMERVVRTLTRAFTADPVIRYAAGQDSIERLTASGKDAQMVEMSGGGHLAVFTSGHDLFKKIVEESIAQ